MCGSTSGYLVAKVVDIADFAFIAVEVRTQPLSCDASAPSDCYGCFGRDRVKLVQPFPYGRLRNIDFARQRRLRPLLDDRLAQSSERNS